jgi:hypothetical protein
MIFGGNVYNLDTEGTQRIDFQDKSVATVEVIGAWAVLLFATKDCHVVAGENPTAKLTDFFLAAGMYLAVNCPAGTKIAVIRSIDRAVNPLMRPKDELGDPADKIGSLYITPIG